jgi:hypothetical protein
MRIDHKKASIPVGRENGGFNKLSGLVHRKLGKIRRPVRWDLYWNLTVTTDALGITREDPSPKVFFSTLGPLPS